MAGNTGKNHRDGAVKYRTQLKAPTGNYVKRDVATGRIMWIKRLQVVNLKVFVQKSRALFYLILTN
ncbi:hypothetical protein ABKP09_24225 [Peribacillus frigoritolerans]|uniref:hypothetical protein n=1 Tax=Peribacillus frigoritolerans TaxID=450367 RepID=UPI0025A17468|nr:hypothetical protein [Peribacillus frigoritolerans]MDM5314353.1 hypothetical protein [Peribacillus frigoritolerans]